MNLQYKIQALEKAIQEEDREKLLNLLTPNMEESKEIKSLPKDIREKWNELEEKGIKILTI